ncbi:hypothetical protein EXN66_Car013540 [Channa argus]|uniref:Ubiquitin-like domain-containing protein n=1 Tax=Channa argus TaxID=215402 RepID=A0A6G1Q604_CHAAH|nr:hypothetical protein EXN66_Car013540 [Channa argus]
MSAGPLKIQGPTGALTWIQIMENILTVKHLKEKAVKELPWIPGQSEDNVRLTLDGTMLEDSTPLFDCKFLPSSAIHLVLRVRGG